MEIIIIIHLYTCCNYLLFDTFLIFWNIIKIFLLERTKSKLLMLGGRFEELVHQLMFCILFPFVYIYIYFVQLKKSLIRSLIKLNTRVVQKLQNDTLGAKHDEKLLSTYKTMILKCFSYLKHTQPPDYMDCPK